MAFLKRVTAPLRLVDKRAEAAVARNVTPRKTLARERAQNKINECYSRLFCSFLSVIFIHIIRNVTKLKCLCGEHLRDNCVVLVGPACSQLIWKCGSCQSSKMGIFRRMNGIKDSKIWNSTKPDILGSVSCKFR